MNPLSTLCRVATLAALACLSVFSAPLPAPGGLSIDFRTNPWAGAEGQTSYTVNYLVPGNVTATAVTASTVLDRGEAEDGLGIDTIGSANEPDEIDGAEILRITFENNTAITGFGITDLFGPPDGSDDVYGEQGRVDFYRDGIFLFYVLFEGRNSTQANGEQLVMLSQPLVIDRADFYVGNRNANNEFAVAGFNIEGSPDLGDVPEPGTISLLALGLGCLALAYRTRQRASRS
jgi:hypothetical protein